MINISKEQKERLFKRDNHKCQICGYDETLTLHHIYGRKQCQILALDDNNLITLCFKCHQNYHRTYKNVTPYTFSKFILSHKHNIRRINVEWMDGRSRDLVFYDEPSEKIKGLVNNNLKTTVIHVLHTWDEEVMVEKEVMDYICENYNVNRTQVHRTLTELVKMNKIARVYDGDRTILGLTNRR